MTTDPTAADWYSDEALRKQAALADWPEGTPPPWSMLVGIQEPRVQPTADEKCVCCGLDSRDEMGGESRPEGRYCYLCLGRGHDERPSMASDPTTAPASTVPVSLPDGSDTTQPSGKWPSTTGSTDDQ